MVQPVGNIFESTPYDTRFSHREQLLQLPAIGPVVPASNSNIQRVGAGSTAVFNTTTGDVDIATDAAGSAFATLFPADDPANISRILGIPFASTNRMRCEGFFRMTAELLAAEVTLAIGFALTSAASLSTDDDLALATVTNGVLGAAYRQGGTTSTVQIQTPATFAEGDLVRIGVQANPNGRIVFTLDGAPYAFQPRNADGTFVANLDAVFNPTWWVNSPVGNLVARRFGFRDWAFGCDA